MATLYHNPRCSKSRQGLELCNESTMEVEIVHYLKSSLTKSELEEIISRLEGCVSGLIRNGDDAFKQSNFATLDLTNSKNVLTILLELPQVMQRPLLDDGKRVIIGRPPQNFSEILG
ncbi:MAG: ArsC/Spx/MgsR family protein [Candidatus Poseidoniaceae archaeon]|nr:ArsC/Spx/MgsR family protein [Candidatus Poseidoniaceae archaeon]